MATGNGSYLEGSKVDDAVNFRMFGKDIVEGLFVGNVELVEVRAATTDLLDTVEDLFPGVVQAVDDDDVVVVLEEGKGCEGANVAGTTSHS